MTLSLFNCVFLVAFGLSAAVQFNDPDALAWIAIYLAAAGMCIAQLRHRPWPWLAPLLLGICLIWVGTLLPDIVGKVSLQEIFDSISMKTRAVEEAREIGGLALVALWSAVLTYRHNTRSESP